MNITLLGSCRLNNTVSGHNNLNNLTNYPHCTKEILQLISFLKGQKYIRNPYSFWCFNSAIGKNKEVIYEEKFKHLFLSSNLFIIEICSRKKYIHGDFYLHNLCVDKRFPEWSSKYYIKDFKIEIQTDEEIEKDILEIKNILSPKKIIIVSHCNAKINGEYSKTRTDLINLVEKICLKYKINFINPTQVLSSFVQDQILISDAGHYTGFGIEKMSEYMNNYIQNLK